MAKILYNDPFVKIDDDRGVIVKKYFFPTLTRKLIPWKNIKHVEYWREKSSAIPMVDYKGWGMGILPVWWAFDPNRYSASTKCVIITTGSKIKKGFSCNNPEQFVSIVFGKIHGNTTIFANEFASEDLTNAEKKSQKSFSLEGSSTSTRVSVVDSESDQSEQTDTSLIQRRKANKEEIS